MRKAIMIVSASLAISVMGAGTAFAAHSHVNTPSGCHETNGNARNGSSDAWTHSADGHARASEAGRHEAGGC